MKLTNLDSKPVLTNGSTIPHRGISQEKLPKYLAFFEFTHNVKKRGKALLESLLGKFLIKKTVKIPAP